jgi:hypothetical protein
MQSAWQEWFSSRKDEPKALPDGKEDFNDKYLPMTIEEPSSEPLEAPQEPVRTSTYVQPQEETIAASEEEIVPIQRTHAASLPADALHDTNITDLTVRLRKDARPIIPGAEGRGARNAGSNTLRAVCVAVAGLSILIALIGTGKAGALLSDRAFKFGIQKTVIDYLGGTRYVENRL